MKKILCSILITAAVPLSAFNQGDNDYKIISVPQTSEIYSKCNYFSFADSQPLSTGEEEPKSTTSNLKTITGPLAGMAFVKVPSGSFKMGSDAGEIDELPVHLVNIKSFYIMNKEVTVGQFAEFVHKTGYITDAEKNEGAIILHDKGQFYPSRFETRKSIKANWKRPELSQLSNHPVVCVSLNDCLEFVNWMNNQDPGKNYRLPSEAEWEYACRAGTSTLYNSGNSENDLKSCGWIWANSEKITHPGGKKRANRWGLYDMHGNVAEWCQDGYHDSYFEAPSNGNAWGPSGNKSTYLVRGGSWISQPFKCRSAHRESNYASYRCAWVGFRLVRNP